MRCATPSPAGARAGQCSSRWSAPTCSSSPLDDSRQWYRYHHLFADVLRAHLLDERPDDVAALHRRAAEWYAAAGEPVPAVRHALAAGDVEQAADVIERSAIELLRERQEATVRSWLDEVPDEVVRRRPVLAVAFIGALMSRNDFETVEGRLDDVERLLGDPSADVVVLDEADLARLPGAIETYRAALALVAGDPAGTTPMPTRRSPEPHRVTTSRSRRRPPWPGSPRGPVGTSRPLIAATPSPSRVSSAPGTISDVLGCSITLGDLRITQGRLGDARPLPGRPRASPPPTRSTPAPRHGGHGRRPEPDRPRARRPRRRRPRTWSASTRWASTRLPQHPYRLRAARAQLARPRETTRAR